MHNWKKIVELRAKCRTILFAAMTAASAVPQQDRGTFTGNLNASGGALSGVRIEVADTATNSSYESVTNEAGRYSIPNLPIGTYKLTFQAPRFKTYVRESVTLSVAQVVRVDVEMELGAVTETIEVGAAAPLLQTEMPEVGSVLTGRRINDLPLGFQRGNTSYKLSQLRGPWELSDDFSLQKSFRPLESLRIQLRADFLNAFNRTLWGNIEVNTASPLFGQVTGASDWFSPRKIQFGVRADW